MAVYYTCDRWQLVCKTHAVRYAAHNQLSYQLLSAVEGRGCARMPELQQMFGTRAWTKCGNYEEGTSAEVVTILQDTEEDEV